MTPVLLLQLGIGFGLLMVVAGLVYVGLREERSGNPLDDRLAALGEREIDVSSLEEIELQLSFKERVLIPVIERLADITARFTPQKQLEQSRKLIEMAGMNTDPTQFFLLRIVLTVVGGLVGMGIGFFALGGNPVQALLATGGGIVLGNYFPVLSMTSRIQKRQAEVVKHLPDALDLLVICVEAGLGFDQAMGKVYEKWDNEMALAFGRVLREIQLGKNRKDALKDMADRLDVPDVNSFTAAIIQAEQLGVSMAKILRVQADQMRIKRRQRAQERAMQAPVKMMIPMVLIIFPSIWIILMGPAAIRIAKQFFL
jgi:tight adherence protein C